MPIHIQEGTAAGGDLTGTYPNPTLASGSSTYITYVDEATATITYVGKAVPTSIGSDAVWRIKRIDTSTLAGEFLYADGDTNFDNIWDNRASFSYS